MLHFFAGHATEAGGAADPEMNGFGPIWGGPAAL